MGFLILTVLNVVHVKYLELRFSRATRLLGTVLFIVQTVSKKTEMAAGLVCDVLLKVHYPLSDTDPLHWDRHLCSSSGFKPGYVVSFKLGFSI